MESSLESKKIVSYLHSQQWAIDLAHSSGRPVDLVCCAGRHTWDWKVNEMPENVHFIQDIVLTDYACSVIPHGCNADDKIAIEMQNKFIEMETKTGLSCIRWSHIIPGAQNPLQDDISRAHPAEAITYRQKFRWQVSSHVSWMRHMHAIIGLIVGEDKVEPEPGTMLDYDCGDFAAGAFMANRFGQIEVIGLCRDEDEQEAARRVNKAFPVSVMDENTKIQSYDYIISTDADPVDLDILRKTIEDNAKKMGIVSFMKTDRKVPTIFSLIERFPKWRINELPSHFFLVYKP